jgi:hypothetical protein
LDEGKKCLNGGVARARAAREVCSTGAGGPRSTKPGFHDRLSAWMVSQMELQDFYVSVGVVFPVLDRKFTSNVDADWATGVVGLGAIRMRARLTSNHDESVSQELSSSARKRFEELNDFVVNEHPYPLAKLKSQACFGLAFGSGRSHASARSNQEPLQFLFTLYVNAYFCVTL